MVLVIFLLALLLLLESTFISTPLVLTFLICLLVIRKDRVAFILGFFVGLLLDILLVRTIGTTAIFFVTTLFLIMLYQRKFEIASFYFTAIAAFFTSLVYLFVFQIPFAFLHATVSAILAILFFALLKRVFAKAEKPLGTV